MADMHSLPGKAQPSWDWNPQPPALKRYCSIFKLGLCTVPVSFGQVCHCTGETPQGTCNKNWDVCSCKWIQMQHIFIYKLGGHSQINSFLTNPETSVGFLHWSRLVPINVFFLPVNVLQMKLWTTGLFEKQ